jgi:hypothetical protein
MITILGNMMLWHHTVNSTKRTGVKRKESIKRLRKVMLKRMEGLNKMQRLHEAHCSTKKSGKYPLFAYLCTRYYKHLIACTNGLFP